MIVSNDYQRVYATVMAGAVNLSALVKAISLPGAISQPRTWSVTFDNSAGTYTLDNYYSALFGVDWTISVTSKDCVSATPIDEVITLTHLIPQDMEFTIADMTCIVNGTDYSDKILQQDQTQGTAKSTAGSTLYSRDAIRTILDYYSASHVTDDASPIDTVSSDNFPIRILHFQGEIPLDVIKKILSVTWADWYFDGPALYVVQFDTATDHVLLDYTDIKDLKFHESKTACITRASATRTLPCSHTALDKEGNTAGVFGAGEYVTLPLDFGIVNAMPSVVQSAFCIIDQWSMGDAGGNWALWPAGPTGGTITQVKFRCQAQSGITESQGAILHWHVKVMGDKPQSGAEWGDLFETDYTLTRKNATLETELGKELPARDPVYEALIPNQAWAEIYLDRKLEASARNRRRVSGPLNGLAPRLRSGDTVEITCGRLGITAEKYFLDSVSHSLTENSAITTISGGKVRADTIETVV